MWAARFIGANRRCRAPRNDFERKKKNETTEVITLSLTFDHRVVNGAGAANFVHEIKELIEHFKIPMRETRTIGR
ncbi:MAG TPA: 2-oxo acid dehydrogenase subunit E2 [Chthoniobacterales bacterium]|nr:2-oxo acid dehydrogenase subunit E2 [Chthoniobacterales bacterium]